jgi:hypothetical protein
MRLLASLGIFSEAEPDAFVATALSDGLREDHPGSVRYMVMQQGSVTYLAAREMQRAVQTGEPVADAVLGMPLFEHLAADPAASDIFNRAMAGGAAGRGAAALGEVCRSSLTSAAATALCLPPCSTRMRIFEASYSTCPMWSPRRER